MAEELSYLLGRAAAGKHSRRAFLGRAMALGLTATMAQGMLSSAVRAQGPGKGGHLRIGLQGGDFTNKLDPLRAVAPVPLFNLRCLGDTLVEVGPDGALVPRLAEETTSAEAGRLWHFRMRRDVLFHDGSALTPGDAKAVIERHRDSANGSMLRGLLSGIEEVTAAGDTLSVRLHDPDPEFPYLLSDPRLVIQPQAALGSAIFSGGYVLKVNEPGVRHLFERNPDYWDSSRAHVEQIEVLVINDNALRMANLRTGQVDVVNRVDPRQAATLAAEPGMVLARSQGPGWQAPSFVMQSSTKPYGSLELRLAMKHAVDRQAILDSVFAGMGTLGNDQPLHAGWAGELTGFGQRGYDPERAAWHFNNAMHDGTPMILRVSDMAYGGAVDAAQMFQKTANAAGIPLEMRREEIENYWPEVWNRQSFSASLLACPVTPAVALSAFTSDSEMNETRFVSERYDSIFKSYRKEADAGLRQERQVELAKILHDEAGLILPVFADVLDLHSQAVQGYAPDPRGPLMGGFAGVKCWLA